MARLLITTVGTSLLTNRDRPWEGWNRRGGNQLPDAADVDQWLAEANRKSASAETNTLQSIEVVATDHVLLLHSDTREGRFCSDRLRRFYTDVVKCRSVEARQLAALGYAGASFTQKGLKALVNEAIEAVDRARERSLNPVFCATGGFKAEIAFLNLLGVLLKVEVVYIHERFREVVCLPRLPLDWDADWVLQRRQFFEWINEDLRSSAEVADRLKADPELQPLVEDAGDGCSHLNAAGELLYGAARAVGPRAVWPPAAALPPGAKNGLSGVQHHRPRGWKEFVQRLCDVPCVRRVSYDEAAYGGGEVKVLDASAGAVGMRWGSADSTLPLRVETTAKNAAQTELVREYIEETIMRR